MCGRYKIEDRPDNDDLRKILGAVKPSAFNEPVKTSGDVFPTDVVPVVANNRRMAPAVFAMRWGYALQDGKRVINARSETAETRPMFRDGMLRRRCAIPATNYYEWESAEGKRVKYAIRPTQGELFYMAGIYRFESGRPVFTILTRAPADSISFIHDRMPVILPADRLRDWLNPENPAGEILNHAVLDVAHAREEDPPAGTPRT